ncbi:MAG: ATP-binding cassette domain-containing protein [Bacteroidales bacterium]|nr:ATP-binding cassette domain-containing protein [Bacteroidales bacterium]
MICDADLLNLKIKSATHENQEYPYCIGSCSTLFIRVIQALSDGERQKVMIAKAIAQQTPIICLDEPTAFLDFPSKIETMQLLQKLCKENCKTIFLSTHDLELTLQIADRIWLMQKDGITIGTPQEVAQSEAISTFIEREGISFDKLQMRVKISR